MSMLHVTWSFKRIGILYILQAIGEGNSDECKSILLQGAVDIIKNAERFKGKLYYHNDEPKSKAKIFAYFSLIFPSDKEFNNFIKELNKGNLFGKGNFCF